MSFPSSLDNLQNVTPGVTYEDDAVLGHSSQHINANNAINALETKVGADSSAVTTTHSYKLSGVTGTDKASSKTGVETLTNKTLTTPVINNPTGAISGSLGSAISTTGQNNISSVVDLTGLSVTVTVPAGGRMIKISGTVTFSGTASNLFNSMQIMEGATLLQANYCHYANSNYVTNNIFVILTPTAGSHTYKLQAGAGSGSINTESSGQIPSFILAEQI